AQADSYRWALAACAQRSGGLADPLDAAGHRGVFHLRDGARAADAGWRFSGRRDACFGVAAAVPGRWLSQLATGDAADRDAGAGSARCGRLRGCRPAAAGARRGLPGKRTAARPAQIAYRRRADSAVQRGGGHRDHRRLRQRAGGIPGGNARTGSGGRAVMLLRLLPWLAAAWLMAVGIYGMVTSRHYVHLIGCLSVVQSGTYVLLLAIGFVWHSGPPIFYDHPPGTPAVDPVMQALVLTDVVVGAAVSALLLALALQLHKRRNTLDPQELEPIP